MVFLPCRRVRKAKDPSLQSEENPPGPHSTPVETIEPPTPVECTYTGEERQALESLFQQMDLPDVQVNLVMPAIQQPNAGIVPVDKKNIKERRSRLDRLSKRLRRRLSRESRLLRPRSKQSVMPQNDGVADGQSINFLGPNLLADILGSGPASEGGYDSDAQGIVTPRSGNPLSAGQTGMSVENLDRVPNNQIANHENAALVLNQGGCSGNVAQPTETSGETSSLRTAKSNMGAHSLVLDDGPLIELPIRQVSSSPCTAKEYRSQTVPLEFDISISPKDGSLPHTSRSKISIPSAEIPQASEPAVAGESVCLIVSGRPLSLGTTTSIHPVSSIGRHIEPIALAVSNSSRDTPHARPVSNSHKLLNPTEVRTCQRDTSSIYASNEGSLPPSPDSSTRFIPLVRPEDLCPVNVLSEAREAGTCAALSPVDKKRFIPAKEERALSIRSSKSQRQPQNGASLLENGARLWQTQSKFTEQIEPSGSNKGGVACPSKRTCQGSSGDSRSTSDGWLSNGKRQGYGYDFVAENDEDTSLMWQRALRAHAQERPSARSGQRSLNSLNFRGRKTSAKSSQDSSELPITKTRSGICLFPEEQAPLPDRRKSAPPGLSKVRSKKERGPESVPDRPLQAWTRFPSHSRAERCASAGTSDNVTVRDFSSTQDQRPILGSSKGSPQVDGQDEYATPGKRGRLRQWARLHRPSNVDLRRYRAGHWARVSRTGHLKYPELEIIPGGPTPYVVMEELGDVDKASRRYMRRQKSLKAKANSIAKKLGRKPEDWPELEIETNIEPEPVISPPPLTPESILDPSPISRYGSEPGQHLQTSIAEPLTDPAQVWSRLYEDCVDRPVNDADSDVASVVSVSSQAAVLPSWDQRLTAISTSIDMHSSTTEFNEMQLADEVKTRDSLMQMVEVAWGARVSGAHRLQGS